MADAAMHGADMLDFSIIPGAAVARVIDDSADACISIVRDAYLAHSDGRSVMPPSSFLRFPDKPNARIIALAAHLTDPEPISGIKWIASYPANLQRRIPRASAVLILNNHDNGYPVACLEASIVSAARTAASAVLAAQQLRPDRKARVLAIVGTGLIARYVYRFLLRSGWEIGRLLLYDLDPNEAARFASGIAEHDRHDSIAVAPDAGAAISAADLLVFTTVAGQPHVHDPALFAHNPLVLHISLRDLAPEVILAANNVVDDVDHVLTAATSLHLAQQQVGHHAFINGTLSEHIRGDCAVDPAKPTIFSPFGMGVLDVALGKFVYERAVAAGDHIPIPGFFHDVAR
ncbi:2,3-diaminopropionate biosynthesis protein SbnB [Sphingomonas qomolangmaensis]|uniref:2,3-diaminopropionate biosynthesis protein SbnB n=1 Tax=Sphingomonas qomolangmaensis TaxID=2918765 RepID=A0ABY5L6B4_9SPHN|nr:2,3-diaminopropionate biosynthesis protein SbnB [Sphingomonas qomolangmaensis]UUL82317.1 2,3-diaminopropionate biosynthesis protein SbnB [Sphingomonas qomolangmaensis]